MPKAPFTCVLRTASLRIPPVRSSPRKKTKAWRPGAFQKKQWAGFSTDTLPDSRALHIPLLVADRAEGVLAVRLPAIPSLQQRELLDGFAAQLALFVNKERALAGKPLRPARRPIAKAAEDTLRFRFARIEDAARCHLRDAQQAGARLRGAARRPSAASPERWIICSMPPASNPASSARREWCDPGELVREAVASALKDECRKSRHRGKFAASLFDAGLIEQALVALLSNAATYSPHQKPDRAER